LPIDANTMLASAVARKCFEPVAGRDAKIVKPLGGIDTADHDAGALGDIRQDPLNAIAIGGRLGVLVAVAANHLVAPNCRCDTPATTYFRKE
jgi:hypothetical protein